jgi:hypothetical protein
MVKRHFKLLGAIPLAGMIALMVSAPAPADEAKAVLRLDGSNPKALQTKFGIYGFRSKQAIFMETDGYRFYLPAQEKIPQTGVYTYFALSGDCEVIASYELLKIETPKAGYGASVGMAFDIAAGKDRGDIQRVDRVGGESGYAIHSSFGGGKGQKKDEDRFVAAKSKRGQMGLRRVKDELIFLAAEDGGELREIDRMPFTEETIRAVRFFADPGGSPTVVDVRVRQIEMRAEEITGGVTEKDASLSPWWWLLLLIPLSAAAAGGGFWFWWSRRQKADADEPETPAPRKVRLKKA